MAITKVRRKGSDAEWEIVTSPTLSSTSVRSTKPAHRTGIRTYGCDRVVSSIRGPEVEIVNLIGITSFVCGTMGSQRTFLIYIAIVTDSTMAWTLYIYGILRPKTRIFTRGAETNTLIYMEEGKKGLVLKLEIACIQGRIKCPLQCEESAAYATWTTIPEASVVPREFLVIGGRPVKDDTRGYRFAQRHCSEGVVVDVRGAVIKTNSTLFFCNREEKSR